MIRLNDVTLPDRFVGTAQIEVLTVVTNCIVVFVLLALGSIQDPSLPTVLQLDSRCAMHGEPPADGEKVWRRSLRNTFRALSDWGDELERRHGASITSARQAVEQHRSLISQASRIGGELSSAAVKLVEEATGRGEGDEPAEAYFEASAHAHAASAASGRGGHASEGQEDVSPESSDLWEEVSAAQAELQCHHELRKGRKAALVAQDEQLRQLRSEVVALRGQIQEAVERRDATRARAEAAERGLEVLQEAQHELQKLGNEHAAELRQLQVAAQQALQSERAWRARAAEGSWAREGPEIEALKAAKVELAELLAEADEVRLASKQASAQLTHQLEGAQAEHARLGGTRATPVAQAQQEPAPTVSPQRTGWRRLAGTRSDDANPFA